MIPCHFTRVPYRNRPADWGCSCGWVLDMSTPILDVFEVYAQHVLEKYKRFQLGEDV